MFDADTELEVELEHAKRVAELAGKIDRPCGSECGSRT